MTIESAVFGETLFERSQYAIDRHVNCVLMLTEIVADAAADSHLDQTTILPHHVYVVVGIWPDIAIVQEFKSK